MFETDHGGNQYPQTNGLVPVLAIERLQASGLAHHPTAKVSQKYDRLLCITCPLIIESTQFVEHVEEIAVFFASEPVHVGNFEVTPVMTPVPTVAMGVASAEPAHEWPNGEGSP